MSCTHVPLQLVCPIVQPDEHVRVASEQNGVAPEQIVPHAPQFCGSVPKSTQRPLHSVVPAGHAHEPPLQVCPAGQLRPHAPQLFGSLVTSMHTPPQSVRPVGQRHAPALHAWSMRQRVPHAPQLRTSLESDTHEFPQRTCPMVQPDEQVRVATLQYGVAPEHETPQAPQLNGSVARSTQNPLQFVVPGGHWQRPE